MNYRRLRCHTYLLRLPALSCPAFVVSTSLATPRKAPVVTKKAVATVPKPNPPIPSASASTSVTPVTIPDWNSDRQGGFVMALARDLNGGVWAGAEDKGVWYCAPNSGQWRQFTVDDGLGDDNVYAIACDKLGRVWVGHQNHGVSVYNGAKWRN